jgi:hypothetical protein
MLHVSSMKEMSLTCALTNNLNKKTSFGLGATLDVKFFIFSKHRCKICCTIYWHVFMFDQWLLNLIKWKLKFKRIFTWRVFGKHWDVVSLNIICIWGANGITRATLACILTICAIVFWEIFLEYFWNIIEKIFENVFF